MIRNNFNEETRTLNAKFVLEFFNLKKEANCLSVAIYKVLIKFTLVYLSLSNLLTKSQEYALLCHQTY